MGGTITAIEAQEHHKERVNIYLDGEFAFGLHLLQAASLKKGQRLSDAEIEALQATDAVQKAYEAAVRFLGVRPRSVAEVRQRLQKHYQAEAIEAVIERLLSLDYLNDLNFARSWVANRQEFRPRSPRALRMELLQKGIANEVIEEVLGAVDADAACYDAAEKKFRALTRSTQDSKTLREKLSAFLLRRGFDYETVRAVVDELLHEHQAAPEDDLFDDE